MHHFLYQPISGNSSRHRNAGLALIATLVLSIGIGTATAAFALLNAAVPHGAPMISCESMLAAPSAAAMFAGEGFQSPGALRQHVSGVYDMTYESVSDVDWSWSDALGDVDPSTLAPFVGAAAIVVLVSCVRGAARLLDASRSFALAGGASVGAIIAAALIVNTIGLPALGPRAIAFAVCVSALSVKFAWGARKELLPAMD